MTKKIKKEVKFVVVVQNRMYDKIAKIASAMDLGISGISAPESLAVSYQTTSKIDKKYIAKMTKILKLAFEKAYEDFRVVETSYQNHSILK